MEICNRKYKLMSTRVVKNYLSSLLLEEYSSTRGSPTCDCPVHFLCIQTYPTVHRIVLMLHALLHIYDTEIHRVFMASSHFQVMN